jgi:hypothetical protein
MQPWLLFVLYAIMGVGNSFITSLVIYRKFRPGSKSGAYLAKLLNKSA